MGVEDRQANKYPTWGGYISTDPFSFGAVFYQAAKDLLPISLTTVSETTVSVAMDSRNTQKKVGQILRAVWTSFRGQVLRAVEIGDYHSLFLLERRDYKEYYSYLPRPHIIEDRELARLEDEIDPLTSITLNRCLLRAYQRYTEGSNSAGVIKPATCRSTTKAQQLVQLGYPLADPRELVVIVSEAIRNSRLF